MSKPQQAVHAYKAGCNCSQAILSTYAPDLGLPPEVACQLATGLGGGMRMGHTCGALSGAILVLGLKYGAPNGQSPQAKARTYQLVEQLTAAFRARNGSCLCKELLGCDIATPAGMKVALETNRFHTLCPKMVQDAAELIDPLLSQGS